MRYLNIAYMDYKIIMYIMNKLSQRVLSFYINMLFESTLPWDITGAHFRLVDRIRWNHSTPLFFFYDS